MKKDIVKTKKIKLRDRYFFAEYMIGTNHPHNTTHYIIQTYVETISENENGVYYTLASNRTKSFRSLEDNGYFDTEKEAIEKAKQKAIKNANAEIHCLQRRVQAISSEIQKLNLTTDAHKEKVAH